MVGQGWKNTAVDRVKVEKERKQEAAVEAAVVGAVVGAVEAAVEGAIEGGNTRKRERAAAAARRRPVVNLIRRQVAVKLTKIPGAKKYAWHWHDELKQGVKFPGTLRKSRWD